MAAGVTRQPPGRTASTRTVAPGAGPAVRLTGRPPSTGARPSSSPLNAAATSRGGAAPQQAPAGAADLAAAPVQPAAVIRNPEDSPAFRALKARARLVAARAKRHQPGTVGAATAQGAAEPDKQADVKSQAAEAQVGDMARQKPGPFDPVAFKHAVQKAIEGAAPPANLDEADKFKESGQAGQASSTIGGILTGGRADSERDIKVTADATPDASGKKPKPVAKMVNDTTGRRPPDVRAADALPGRRPPEQTDLSAGPAQLDAKMAGAKVTEEQLRSANEPSFGAALDTRREVREHAVADPPVYRAQEQAVIAGGRAEAATVAAQKLNEVHGARAATLGAALTTKNATKGADERLHNDVHQRIVEIHERAQSDVKKLLAALDTDVDRIFTDGEKDARQHFEDDVDRKMRAYKEDRYGGWGGGALWLKDRFFDLPSEVNEFYRVGRQDYLNAMDRVVDAIAAVVGGRLGDAQRRIQAGRDEVHTFVDGLQGSARELGKQTADDLDGGFDQLASDVDAKRGELVDTVARKYVESRDKLDTRIKDLQEANKGLVSKAIDAIGGVLKTIYELGKLLLRVLLKAASAVDLIIAHPIRFLGNLVGAVKGGLGRFVSRIGVHLQESLVDLLFGELGSAGITIPEKLDFAGIVDLVLQVLGLTYKDIRERAVNRFGEPVVALMEKTAEIFKILVKDGVAGLWKLIQAKMTELTDLVIGKIKEYVIERVVKAGIGYIVALLNPVAAFIKACMGIYEIVMFIVEKAKQLAAFVDAVLDSIIAIAQGNVGSAEAKIESALARGLTLAIGFLARLARLGAISEKVRSIIDAVRNPIRRVVDAIIFGAAEAFRRTLGSAVAFGKAKVQAGKDWAQGKVEAGKSWATQKAVAIGIGDRKPPDSVVAAAPEEKSERVRALALAELRAEAAKGRTGPEMAQVVRDVGARLRPDGLQRIEEGAPDADGVVTISAAASPFLPLAKLVDFRGTVPKGRSETLFSELRLSAPATVTVGRVEPRDKEGEVLPPGAIGVKVASRGAGIVRSPTSTVVRVATWNTANLKSDDNVSHAEHQFMSWLRSQKDILPLIEQIHLNLRPFSPCARCTGELRNLLRDIAEARGNRPFTREVGDAILTWTEPYPGLRKTFGTNRTTKEGVEELIDQGWKVHAPRVDSGDDLAHTRIILEPPTYRPEP